MNKIQRYLFLLCCLAFFQVEAQPNHKKSGVRLNPFGTYAPVNSYSGAQIPNAFTLQIHIDYNVYLQPGWKLEYRLTSPIKQPRSEEHTSELQSRPHLVCRLLLEKKKKKQKNIQHH